MPVFKYILIILTPIILCICICILKYLNYLKGPRILLMVKIMIITTNLCEYDQPSLLLAVKIVRPEIRVRGHRAVRAVRGCEHPLL